MKFRIKDVRTGLYVDFGRCQGASDSPSWHTLDEVDDLHGCQMAGQFKLEDCLDTFLPDLKEIGYSVVLESVDTPEMEIA